MGLVVALDERGVFARTVGLAGFLRDVLFVASLLICPLRRCGGRGVGSPEDRHRRQFGKIGKKFREPIDVHLFDFTALRQLLVHPIRKNEPKSTNIN